MTKMYSIRDSKSETFHKPWHAHTHGEAERQFQTLVNDKQSQNLHDFPEDFDLYMVGVFDDQTGKIKALETPEHLIKAIALKNPKNQ